MAEPVRVLIVDDHEVVRRGLAGVIEATDDLTVVAEASSVTEAARRCILTEPDVLVVDLQLPDGTGLDVIRSAAARMPGVRSVVLTSFGDADARAAALDAGAYAFVIKSVRGTEIVEAVRAVAAGRRLLRAGQPRPVTEHDPMADLTRTERQVVHLIGDGLPNREIAETLGVAEKTVKNHVTSLLAKMGLQRRTQVAAWVVGHRGNRWREIPK